MYLRAVPGLIQRFLRKAVWSIPGDKKVYLTFDDGPSQRTNEILDLLYKYGAKASFFLLGEQVEKFPSSMARIKSEGHTIGNHGYAHLDGWRCSVKTYFQNIKSGQQITRSTLYRPPYGRMTPSQWSSLPKDHQIVMWSLMPGDFDSSVSANSCLTYVLEKVKGGSIIVLHDNSKCTDKVLQILPALIGGIKEKGFQLEALTINS